MLHILRCRQQRAVVQRISIRHCAAVASAVPPSDETPALQAQFEAWGTALAEANQRDAHCSTQGPVHSNRVALEAHAQLKQLVAQWNAEAKVYLCGSLVTQGHLSHQSDLDFVCLPGTGEVQPERSVQLAGVEGSHRALLRHTPSYMRRQLVQLKTARTPVVKFAYTHEPPLRSRSNSAGVVSAEAQSLNESVAPAVVASRFNAPPTDAATVALSNTILVHLRGVETNATAVAQAVSAAGLQGRVHVVDVTFPVPDVFQHPMGFDVPTTAAEDNSITAQTETAMLSAKSTSTLLRLRGETPMDTILALGLFPDGVIIPKLKRDLVTTDFADRRHVPALFRCQWDVSFAGFSVVNSYLIRYYLRGPKSPKWVKHGALALKRWGRCTHVTNAHSGMLTPYAMTLMWIYFLLVTKQLEWVDPSCLPVAGSMPLTPPQPADAANLLALDDPADRQALGRQLAWFFRFYAGPHEEIDDRGRGFTRELEVASVSRPRRSFRTDVSGWEAHPTLGAKPGFLFCIEDPYELRGPNEGGLNLGRHLSAEKLDFIQHKILRALKGVLLYGPSDDRADRTLLGTTADAEPESEDEA